MILAGQILLPDPRCGTRVEAGQVRIVHGKIAEVSTDPKRPIGTPDLGSEHCLISPGFIDTHLHLPQFGCIGIDGLTLMDWLERAVFPTEARWADAAHAGLTTTRVAARLLAAGTTGIAAYATVHHDGARAAVEALHHAGLRAIVGQVLMDQQAPTELVRPAKQLLAEAAAMTGRGRVEVAVTPRFAVSCSRELLVGCGKLAAATGWPVQTHLSETLPECDLVGRLHGGLPYAEVYRRAGLLTKRTILGHGIWLNEDEKRAIAGAGSVVAHCPTANIFLQAGLMDRAGHAGSGVRIGLGSDVAGGPDPCMVRVARAMIETAKVRGLAGGAKPVAVPTPGEAWAQITWRNADALGWADSGRIEPGAWADLVVIDPTVGPAPQAAWRKAVDPLSVLLYGFDERWIVRTLVGGRA